MGRKKSVTHTTIRNSNLFCLNCGKEHKIDYPIEIPMVTAMMNAFNEIHRNCPPTWKQPEADMTTSVEQRAEWWWRHGERGSSSEAIYYCLTGTGHKKDHPYDPDDFSRCYKLLKAIPEWRKELHKVKSLSPVWEKLVDNWDILTRMFEENVTTNWKRHEEIGMNDLMQKLREPNPPQQ